jgi:hypothetical protein
VETGGGAEEDPGNLQGDLKKVQGDREGDAVGSGEVQGMQETPGMYKEIPDGGTYRDPQGFGGSRGIGGQCRRIRGIRWKHREKKNILQKILVINHSGKIDMYCIF